MVAAKAAYAKRKARRARARPIKSLVSQIKSISLGQCETKTAGQYENSIDLYHNLTHYVKNLLSTKQDVTANPGATEAANRIGNEVVARGLKIKLQFISDPKRPNQNVRYFVFRYEANEPLTDAAFWAGPAGAGATMNRMLDHPDTRNVTILKTGLVQNRNKLPSDADTGVVNNIYRDIWIPLNNRKVRYDANNSDVPKYTTIGMCFVAYDANNTLQTDILQYLGYSTRFYFKDP
jgi:hypothetical protein